jgi:hypothetical protein
MLKNMCAQFYRPNKARLEIRSLSPTILSHSPSITDSILPAYFPTPTLAIAAFRDSVIQTAM